MLWKLLVKLLKYIFVTDQPLGTGAQIREIEYRNASVTPERNPVCMIQNYSMMRPKGCYVGAFGSALLTKIEMVF